MRQFPPRVSVLTRPDLPAWRAVLALLVATYYGFCCWWPKWMTILGVGTRGFWFLDMHAVLAASDANALGIPADQPNPLDPMRQPHWYSDWWFGLHALHLTRADHVWLGAAMGFGFIIIATLVARTRSAGEVLFSAAIIGAPPILLGFGRGNVDLFIFILLSAAVPCLVSPHRTVRWLAPALILLTAGLKFYPAVLLVILLAPTRPRRETIVQLAVSAGVLVAIAINQWDSFHRYLSGWHPYGLYAFGIGATSHLLVLPSWFDAAAWVALAVVPLVAWWRAAPAWTTTMTSEQDRLGFLLGAITLCGCYFATVNYSYRAVCAVWMTPLLWQAWTNVDWPRIYQQLARLTSVLLVVWLWCDGLLCSVLNLSRPSGATNTLVLRILIAEQALVAALMIALLGFVVPFCRDALRALRTAPAA